MSFSDALCYNAQTDYSAGVHLRGTYLHVRPGPAGHSCAVRRSNTPQDATGGADRADVGAPMRTACRGMGRSGCVAVGLSEYVEFLHHFHFFRIQTRVQFVSMTPFSERYR